MKRHLRLHATDFESSLRHSIDDTTRLVLPDSVGTGLTHGEQATSPIPAHARENHAHSPHTRRESDGREKHVNGGPVPVDGPALGQAAVPRPIRWPRQLQVRNAAGCKVDLANR